MNDQPRRRLDFQVPRGVVRHRSRLKPCRACGRLILFWTPSAGRTPLDVQSAIDDPANVVAMRLESHFAHCPNADAFRRKDGDS